MIIDNLVMNIEYIKPRLNKCFVMHKITTAVNKLCNNFRPICQGRIKSVVGHKHIFNCELYSFPKKGEDLKKIFIYFRKPHL